MKRKDNIDSKKKMMTYQTVASVLLMIAGVALLIWGSIRQDRGSLDETDIVIMLAGCFGCFILAIILLFRMLPHELESAFDKLNAFYEEKELTELSLPGKEELDKQLSRQRFRVTEDGYYTKAKFTFLKDRIHYYIRVIEDIDVVSAVQRETERFDGANRKRKNFCLLLFIYLDRVGKFEKEAIRNIEKNFIISEQLLIQSDGSLVVVAVDEHTETGCFLDLEKRRRIMLYSNGCEMLKRIAEVKNR